jgi:hypothetical protein
MPVSFPNQVAAVLANPANQGEFLGTISSETRDSREDTTVLLEEKATSQRPALTDPSFSEPRVCAATAVASAKSMARR